MNICNTITFIIFSYIIFYCRVFVRALFNIEESIDKNHFSKSNKVKLERVIPLIDLIPRPVIKVTDIGLQTVIV